MRIAIIGGGLAGCAAAYVLTQAGHDCVIYEAGDSLASGASGNKLGLYNPRFAALWLPESKYYSAAFHRALAVFPVLGDIGFNPCGTLDLIMDEKKRIRFTKMLDNWGWGEEEMRILNAAEASAVAGISLDKEALYVPRSGSVSPPQLCATYVRGVEVRLNEGVLDLDDIDADKIVLAAGPALLQFTEAKRIDLRIVRGQVTYVKATPESEALNCHLCYGGYASRAVDGEHLIGATFQRDVDCRDVQGDDDRENLEKFIDAVPGFPQGLEITGSRASVRVTSRDYFPVVGQVRDDVYISAAHGSHGILSSLMAAEILAAMIDGKELPVSDDVVSALSPARFKD